MNIITRGMLRQFNNRVSSSRKDNKFGLPACTTGFMKCSSLYTSCRPLKIGVGGGGALSSLGRPNCIVCPNLCVKRLLLARGERGEGGGRSGGGRDRERRGIWGEKGDREKRGGRKVGRGGRKVGGRGAKMGRGEWRGGTEEIENRNGCRHVWYIQCSISLCAYLHCMCTCEVLNQQQSEEGEGDYYTFKSIILHRKFSEDE